VSKFRICATGSGEWLLLAPVDLLFVLNGRCFTGIVRPTFAECVTLLDGCLATWRRAALEELPVDGPPH
jgi:hypothetical protein